MCDENITYQNPPTDYDITTATLNHLQDEIDEINNTTIPDLSNTITQVRQSNVDTSNVLFIGDSFADGYYSGYDSAIANENNWCVYLAKKMNITNYRKYSKGGLCFTQNDNRLSKFLKTVIIPAEKENKDKITSIIMMMGVNDSVISTSNDNVRAGANDAFSLLREEYPNATIYFFYSAVQRLLEGKSYRVIAECANNNDIAFIGESYIWNIGYDTTYYVKGADDSCYHPTIKGSESIAQKMNNYFRIGDIMPFHTFYTSFNHTSTSDKPFDITGGMFIKVDNNVMHINIQANIYLKDTSWGNAYCELANTIPDAVVGNSDRDLVISTYDIANHKSGAFSINSGNKRTLLVMDSVNDFLSTGVFFDVDSSVDLTTWCYL